MQADWKVGFRQAACCYVGSKKAQTLKTLLLHIGRSQWFEQEQSHDCMPTAAS
jgi:hypothetical protein